MMSKTITEMETDFICNPILIFHMQKWYNVSNVYLLSVDPYL